jgi:hypothetical protein
MPRGSTINVFTNCSAFSFFFFVFGATENNSQTGNIFNLTRKAYLIVLIQPTSMFKPHFVANCLHMEFYLQSGEQMKSKAQGAVDAVKSTLGANK